MEQAVEELDATCQEAEAQANESEADREERLRLLAEAGFNPIIAVGFVYSPSAAKVAEEYPDANFAVVDGYATFITGDMVEIPNVADLNFAEEQGSFLVGVAAALTTKTDNVGFIGGTNTPLIQKFEAGFKAGVAEIDPKITVQSEYLSQGDPVKGFENPTDGKTVAEGMYEKADVVYHAAGKSGLGLFDAVTEAGEGKYAIGVDSDQYLTADEEQKPLHPHLDAQAHRRRGHGVRHRLRRGRRPRGCRALRPQGRRRRLLDVQRGGHLRHPGPDRRVRRADQERRDQGPQHPVTLDSRTRPSGHSRDEGLNPGGPVRAVA